MCLILTMNDPAYLFYKALFPRAIHKHKNTFLPSCLLALLLVLEQHAYSLKRQNVLVIPTLLYCCLSSGYRLICTADVSSSVFWISVKTRHIFTNSTHVPVAL